MARLGAFLLPFLVVLSFGTTSLSAVAQEPSDGAAVVQDPSAIVDPTATVFTAEFRLIDHDGVQQFARTPPMKASPFRYACGRQG